MTKRLRIKFRNPVFRLTWSVLVWLLLVVGCQSPVTPPASPGYTALPPTPTIILPMPSASHTKTSLPTATPSLTPTFTPSATWTPLPTLLPTEAQALVLDLLQNNAGCRLPCWWGFTPGKTTWEAARQFLASFATRIGQGGSGQVTENGVTYHTTNYSVFYEVLGEPERDETNYSLKNEIIDVIQVGSGGTVLSYQLHLVLAAYGMPTEILLKTYTNSPENYLPFRLVLFYPQQGILAYYEYEAHKIGDQMRSCPQPLGPRLWLWSPEQETIQIADVDPPDTNQPLRPLEEVTEMDLQTFYQTFKNPNSGVCLETPVELWR